jgi:fatty-acyl-CoA synthase
LAGLIDELATTYGDRPAVSFEQETLTFAAFRARARACAKALHVAGVRKGDKVGVLMGNRIEWLVVAMGAQYLGAVLVGLNTWYTDRELSYVLEHADIRIVVTADHFLRHDYIEMFEGLRPWHDKFPQLEQVVVFGRAPHPPMIAYEAFLKSGESVDDATIDAHAQAVDPDDVAYMLYTSGSTSHPKGVMLGHRGLIENMYEIGQRLNFTADDALFLPVSLFWGMGCENGLLAAWTHGTHLVLQHHFDTEEAIELMDRFGCTALYGTANIIQAVFEHPSRASHDLSRMRKGVTGGTPEQIREVIDTFMPEACHAYGMTETYGFMTVGDARDPADIRATTHGKLLPGMDIRIVDLESGADLPAGMTGEVRIRGYTMLGYYKAPEVTAATYDAEGYMITGDLGHFDEGGNFYFRGRMKEMLKTGGLNVSPVEVEEVLRGHKLIVDAFVTGLPDRQREEIVAAVIVPAEGAELTEATILDHCRSELAAFKVPRRIRFARIEEVPLTTTGKVHKQKLAELFETETP